VAGKASGLKKTEWRGCWHGYLSGARCRLAYGPHCHSLSLAPENPDWFRFYFSKTVHPGSPGQNPERRKIVVVVL